MHATIRIISSITVLFCLSLLNAAEVTTNLAASPTLPPEILTPKPAATPRINGQKIFGVRPVLPKARATEKMSEANKLIQPLVDDKSVFYFDLAAKMTPVGNSWKGLGSDRLHLLPEGYELWASEMEPLLTKLLADNP